MKDYHYSEESDGTRINISGKTMVLRGRRVLGLRSNVAKATFLRNIHGTIEAAGGTTEFTAADAEWDTDASHPFLLKNGVTISTGNRNFPGVHKGRIFFKQGFIEATGSSGTTIHHFK